MQPRSSMKPLVEGALAAALAAILALVGLYVPILSGLATLIWTVPITILIVRYSLREGLLAIVVAAILVVLLSNPFTAVFYVLQFAPVGIFFGLAFQRRLAVGGTVLGGMAISIISTAAVTLLSFQAIGLNLNDIDQQLAGTLDSMLQFYQRSGILELYAAQGITEQDLREATMQMFLLFKRLFPGILAFGAAASASVSYLITHLIARRLLIPIRSIPPFREWQMPWYLTWGVVLGFAALLGGDFFNISWLKASGQNLLLFYAPFLTVFGLSVISYFYAKSQIPRGIKIGLIILSCLYLSITLTLVMVLGLFDPLFNYRKLAR